MKRKARKARIRRIRFQQEQNRINKQRLLVFVNEKQPLDGKLDGDSIRKAIANCRRYAKEEAMEEASCLKIMIGYIILTAVLIIFLWQRIVAQPTLIGVAMILFFVMFIVLLVWTWNTHRKNVHTWNRELSLYKSALNHLNSVMETQRSQSSFEGG